MSAQADTSSWTQLGPTNLGGRTLALLIDPGNPATMYAGTAGGGIWKSGDTGASWRPVGDMLPSLAVSALVMDPTSSSILYAGTGYAGTLKSTGRNFDETRGAGVFRSVDAGESWTQLAGSDTMDFHYVNKLALSPATGLLYAATLTGVWRFNVAAGAWVLLQGTSPARRTSPGCFDLTLRADAADNDVLIAACGSFLRGGVFRNAQAQVDGSPWQMVLPNASMGPASLAMGRTSLAMAPSNPDIVYAVVASHTGGPHDNYNQGLLGVWRSTHGGVLGSWKLRLLNDSSNVLSTLLFSDAYHAAGCGHGHRPITPYTNLGWYDNVIAVDPKNSDRVWVGGYDLYRSDDGGMTFGAASYWWATGQPSYIHRFQHALAFSPGYDETANQTLFIANDGGVFVTQNSLAATASGSLSVLCNATNSSVAFSSLNNGFAVTEFFGGAVSPDGAVYIGGSLNGTLKGSDAGGPSGWSTLLEDRGGNVAVDMTTPATLYVASQLRLDGSNDTLDLEKSTDDGTTFHSAAGGITDASFLSIAPFIIDSTYHTTLWTGGSHVWLTEDGARHWFQASGRIVGTSAASISAIASSPANPNYVLAGTDEGIIHYNHVVVSGGNGHMPWNWAKPQSSGGNVSSLTFHPSDANVAYATYATFGGSHVWKTVDGGLTWTAIDGTGTGALPDVEVNSIIIDPANPSSLYIGTDMGIFVSTDDGQSWAKMTAFPNASVEQLVVNVDDASRRTVYAFTHGRGAWRMNLP
ncbi:MAG TPA: hypothetical protein VHB47_14340 [Thermoanaerobaculia bacterium]|jgi:hypothetical protein|nr:hypothetical protein [Thermoanaerobaculia bacterium]